MMHPKLATRKAKSRDDVKSGAFLIGLTQAIVQTIVRGVYPCRPRLETFFDRIEGTS